MEEGKVLGMYEISNKSYPKIKIGKYTICRQDNRSVWIQTEDGEGGQFSDESFLKTIDVYYKTNF